MFKQKNTQTNKQKTPEVEVLVLASLLQLVRFVVVVVVVVVTVALFSSSRRRMP